MQPKIKVKCIDAEDSGNLLTKGAEYYVVADNRLPLTYNVNGRSWGRPRFVVVIEDNATAKRVRCVNPGYGLTLNNVYDVVSCNSSGGYVVINDYNDKQFYAFFRFELVNDQPSPITVRSIKLDGVDVEEERCRKLLTTPYHDAFTCTSCSMPKPCKWH